MTKAGLVFGTPAYMSPEQALGVDVDGRADLYSVGIILYEMINGRPPFMNDDPVALVRMQVTNEPPPLPEHVPELVVDFIWRLLAKQREDRFQSATEAREALERIIPLVVSTDVIVAAGFAVSNSGTLSLPTNSGLLHLPQSTSGPVLVATSTTGPIRLRATSHSKVERLPVCSRSSESSASSRRAARVPWTSSRPESPSPRLTRPRARRRPRRRARQPRRRAPTRGSSRRSIA
jgi:serine/threonine protein kinase